MSLPVGSRVLVAGKPGTVRFFGETQFGAGEWVGVELDAPDGKIDGKVNEVQYFTCAPNHGLFVRKIQVLPLPHGRSMFLFLQEFISCCWALRSFDSLCEDNGELI